MLIYSKNGELVDGVVGQYRNPDYFERAETTEKVVIVGDYPHIKEAYEVAGVLVEVLGDDEKPKPKPRAKTEKEPTDA